MPLWIIVAALGTVALTALLTWILWRMNEPVHRQHEAGDTSSSSDARVFPGEGGGNARDSSDGTSNGGSGSE
ncbi:MAG: hypothetical protein ACT4OF_12710 [Caulobacteraceae bacterium]